MLVNLIFEDYISHMRKKTLTAVSLFSSAGIGDLALREAGAQVLVANELLEDRAALFTSNFPDCEMLVGDIRELKSAVIAATLRCLSGRNLDILFATPPCQGMSKNGRGKLLNLARSGARPKLDPRNQLAIEVVDIAVALKPKLIIFENVSEMQDTIIEVNGQLVNIFDAIADGLGPEYKGEAKAIEFADYGVPQRRKRLITIFSRIPAIMQSIEENKGAWLPVATHAQKPLFSKLPWVTVMDAIGHLEELDAATKPTSADPSLPLHRVPTLDSEKYFWVSNTPPGRGAFDNQCVNIECRNADNVTHGSVYKKGINQAKKDTPIYCSACGSLLPRPWVVEGGKYRLMSGFTSAYKRMRGDLPASALTRNLSYACSDQKLHPTQHRVLSLHEALILHTMDKFQYRWVRADGKKLSDKTIREVIGESIPPAGLQPIFDHVFAIAERDEWPESVREVSRRTELHRYSEKKNPNSAGRLARQPKSGTFF